MRTTLTVCTVFSLLITAFCFFEYQLPQSQFMKVWSELNQAGVNDHELIDRIREDIIGVQETWWPLFILTSVQNILLLTLTVHSFKKTETSKLAAYPSAASSLRHDQ
jgi:hypothetical protein